MSEQRTGGMLDLVKPQMTEAIDKTIPDLANNMQIIDNGFGAHLADYASKQFGERPYTSIGRKTYYIDEVSGSDSNDGETAQTAFKTWGRLWAKIPIFLNHLYFIKIIGNTSIPSPVFKNLITSETLFVEGETGVASNHNVVFLDALPQIRGCIGGSTGSGSSDAIRLRNLTIDSELVIAGCNIRLDGCALKKVTFVASKAYLLNNTFSSTNDAINAQANCQIFSFNNSGNVTRYGLVASNGSVISKRGTQPTGNEANEFTEHGGVIR